MELFSIRIQRTFQLVSTYVDDSNICESITEEDFLQELENPTF